MVQAHPLYNGNIFRKMAALLVIQVWQDENDNLHRKVAFRLSIGKKHIKHIREQYPLWHFKWREENKFCAYHPILELHLEHPFDHQNQ